MFSISPTPIDPRALEAAVHSDGCGGVVTFIGVVRDRANDGRSVNGLSYEAYEEMAIAEFAKIADEVRDRFRGVTIAIVHRIGDLRIGEIAVAVAAAATHRGDAFDACEYAIDELKARAPIWKKEHYVDGEAAWVRNEC
jgi:molybdopterin synthase catalytic subunit